MKRWLPAPLLSVATFATWLLLNESLAPGHLLIGAIAGLVLPLLTRPLRPPAGRLRRPGRLLRLVAVVGWDVLVSALQVARGVFRAGRRTPQGRFVVVPLQLHDPFALAALAVITTVVPGTVWCELARDHSELLVHVFDVRDEMEFIARFKSRYEQPLKEIFE